MKPLRLYLLDGVHSFVGKRGLCGLALVTLLSCGGDKGCEQDIACSYEITFIWNVSDLQAGSYELRLTELSFAEDARRCEIVVSNDQSTTVEFTVDCPLKSFQTIDSGQAKLTLPLRTQNLTITLLQGTKEVAHHQNVHPDYDGGNGCEVCGGATLTMPVPS